MRHIARLAAHWSGQASKFFYVDVEQTGRPPQYGRISMSIRHMLVEVIDWMHSTHRPSTLSLGNRHCGRYVALSMAKTSVASSLLLVCSDFLYFRYSLTYEGPVSPYGDGFLWQYRLISDYYLTRQFLQYCPIYRLFAGETSHRAGLEFYWQAIHLKAQLRLVTS